jgi:hypothetical protein
MWLERSGIQPLEEGVFSRKNKHSGMTDSEALHHLVKHSVQFHPEHRGVTGYSWKSSAGKTHYEEYHSKGNTNHADMIHQHVIPEIKYQEENK